MAVEDVSGVSEYTPRPQDVGVPHVTAFQHRDGWSVAFEFGRGGHPNRSEFLPLGLDYLETAREALREGRFGPFLDNAFSACELLAKAELLSNRPTVELVLNSHSHAAVARPFNAWAKLGNTDARFAKLLGQLAELRPSARYLQRDLGVSQTRAAEILGLLDEMSEHVQAQVDGRTNGGASSVFYVYAAREIRAGEIVREGDFSLVPSR